MTTERETLLAEIAGLKLNMAQDATLLEAAEARLAELDAEPFRREERFIVVKRKHLSPSQEVVLRDTLRLHSIGTVECVVVESDWPEYETVWQMIEARCTAKPPPTGSVMGEAEIEALARHCLAAGNWGEHGGAAVLAERCIRETLSHVQPRWPSEGELQEMANKASIQGQSWKGIALDMARRIRTYQQGEQA
jgi:hypothetical protein